MTTMTTMLSGTAVPSEALEATLEPAWMDGPLDEEPRAAIAAFVGASAPRRPIRMMQDLLDALPSMGFSASTQAQIRPALKRCAKVYNTPLERIPADLDAFVRRWGEGRIGALAQGFRSHEQMVEWRRRVRQALARAAGSKPAGGGVLSPDWEELALWLEGMGGVGRPLGPHRQHGVRALGRLAGPVGVGPQAVTQGWIEEAFRPLGRTERRAAKRGLGTLAELMRRRAEFPDVAHLLPTQVPEQPARAKLPPSPWRRGGPRPSRMLWADFDAFVLAKRGRDELGRVIPPEKSEFKARSEETYVNAVAQAAALLERFGALSPHEPLRLADLCTPVRIAQVANGWLTRALDGEVRADGTTRHLLVERLAHVATTVGALDKRERKELRATRAQVRKTTPTRGSMSPPRLEWLKAFAKSPTQQRALHLMPERLMREAETVLRRWHLKGRARPGQRERMRALSLGLAAVAAALLFRGSPVRAKNLRGLTFRGEGCQVFLHPAEGEACLSIPGELVKNGQAIAADVDADGAPVVEWYLERIRPRLVGDHPYKRKSMKLVDSDFLFPSTRADHPLEETTFAHHYALGVEAVGLAMTLHQARGITGWLILSEDPSAMGLVAEILGDEVATVEAHYAWMDGVKAVREGRALLHAQRRRAHGHKTGSYAEEVGHA